MKTVKFNLLKWIIILSPVLLCLFGILTCLIPYYISVYYTGTQVVQLPWVQQQSNYYNSYYNHGSSSQFSSTTSSSAAVFTSSQPFFSSSTSSSSPLFLPSTFGSHLIKPKHKLQFISTYTNYIPSSGAFTACLSITNYFLSIIIIIKYLINKINFHKQLFVWLNNLCLFIGLVVQLNAIMLQSFHLHTNKQIHNMASLLTVSCLIVYLWIQTVFTFDFNHELFLTTSTSTRITSTKGAKSLDGNSNTTTIVTPSTVVAHSVISKHSFSNTNSKHVLIILFLIRFFLVFLITCLFLLCIYLLNAILQWLTILMILIYFLTFIYDFYKYEYTFQVFHSSSSSSTSGGSNRSYIGINGKIVHDNTTLQNHVKHQPNQHHHYEQHRNLEPNRSQIQQPALNVSQQQKVIKIVSTNFNSANESDFEYDNELVNHTRQHKQSIKHPKFQSPSLVFTTYV